MRIGDVSLISPYATAQGFIFTTSTTAALETIPGTPSLCTIYHNYGQPSEVSTTYSISSIGCSTIALGAVTTGSDRAYSTGDFVLLRLSTADTGAGTVTSVSVATANGISGSVATATSTPAITLTLGAITPTSIGSATTATTQTASDSSTKIATTAFVAAATTISASNIGAGTLAAARLPTTGLTITQYAGVITADSDGATITFDLSASNWHKVTLGGDRTLALSNPTTGQQFSIILVQDGGAPRLVTWFSGIKWAGGTVPTLTATNAAIDVFTFKCVSNGVYYGFIAGQAMA